MMRHPESFDLVAWLVILGILGIGAILYVGFLIRWHIRRAYRRMLEWDRRESGR